MIGVNYVSDCACVHEFHFVIPHADLLPCSPADFLQLSMQRLQMSFPVSFFFFVCIYLLRIFFQVFAVHFSLSIWVWLLVGNISSAYQHTQVFLYYKQMPMTTRHNRSPVFFWGQRSIYTNWHHFLRASLSSSWNPRLHWYSAMP